MTKKLSLDVILDDSGCILLPTADRIQGLTYTPNPSNPLHGQVQLAYSTRQNKRWMHLHMSTGDALYLLNMLEAWSREQGLDALRRPPAPAGNA